MSAHEWVGVSVMGCPPFHPSAVGGQAITKHFGLVIVAGLFYLGFPAFPFVFFIFIDCQTRRRFGNFHLLIQNAHNSAAYIETKKECALLLFA